ncbi:MAG: DinB family protein [Planctomycetota bacterium]
MSDPLPRLPQAVGDEAGVELDQALKTIHHCVGQLTDAQLWWRPSESMNSIANLLLHLCGNLRQWIIAGVGGAPDVRQRQKEFDDRSSIDRTELLQRVDETVTEVKTAMADVSAEDLLRVRCVQGNDVSGLQAIIHSIAHFRGHTQEIVHMTRCQLNDSYAFDFVPSAAEQ